MILLVIGGELYQQIKMKLNEVNTMENTFDKTDIYKLLDILIGNIEPVGETNADNKFYERQDCAEYVLDMLLDKIFSVTSYRDSPAYSEQRAGTRAVEYLKDVYGWLGERLYEIGE